MRDVEQTALAGGPDLGHALERRRKLSFRRDDAHAARPLGHQHPAVGQERQRPRMDQASCEGAHLEFARRRRKHGVFAARAGGDHQGRRQQDRCRQRAVTSPTGVFIDGPFAMKSSRVAAQKLQTRKCRIGIKRRDRHRHGDLDREHRQRDDEAQRQRTDRQRGGDGVGQSGRSDWRGAAPKARRAGRPYHGLNPSRRGRITRDVRQSHKRRRQYCGGGSRKWRNRGKG